MAYTLTDDMFNLPTMTGKINELSTPVLVDYFKPKNPFDLFNIINVMEGVSVPTDIPYITVKGKVTTAATAPGLENFDPVAGNSSIKKKRITPYPLQALVQQSVTELKDSIFYDKLNTGAAKWDITKVTNKNEFAAMLYSAMISAALELDIPMLFWDGDIYKETLTTAGNYSGTADKYFRGMRGMWPLLYEKGKFAPNFDNEEIQLVNYADGSVAQISKMTLTTGSSGDLIVTFMGTNYTEAFATDFDTTIDNFVATHATNILNYKKVVISNDGSNKLKFLSNIPGQPFLNPTFHASSDITGTVGDATANTPPAALAADAALTQMRAMKNAQSAVMRARNRKSKVWILDPASYSNFEESMLGFSSTYKWTSEAGRRETIEGVDYWMFDGSPVVEINPGEYPLVDFPRNISAGSNPARTNRIIFTTLKNPILGCEVNGDQAKFEGEYNFLAMLNYVRVNWFMGAEIAFNREIVVGFRKD